MTAPTRPTTPVTKQLTTENWLQPDPAMTGYVRVSPEGMADAGANDWAETFLDAQLLPSVPPEVRGLFEAARGALVYGYFYYPLYMLGTAELFRAADAAVAHKYADLGGPPPAKKDPFGPSFAEKIEWLDGQGVLQQADWDPIRDARNFASHQKDQQIITPAIAHTILARVTERINALFP